MQGLIVDRDAASVSARQRSQIDNSSGMGVWRKAQVLERSNNPFRFHSSTRSHGSSTRSFVAEKLRAR